MIIPTVHYCRLHSISHFFLKILETIVLQIIYSADKLDIIFKETDK